MRLISRQLIERLQRPQDSATVNILCRLPPQNLVTLAPLTYPGDSSDRASLSSLSTFPRTTAQNIIMELLKLFPQNNFHIFFTEEYNVSNHFLTIIFCCFVMSLLIFLRLGLDLVWSD